MVIVVVVIMAMIMEVLLLTFEIKFPPPGNGISDLNGILCMHSLELVYVFPLSKKKINK
jgi:hypothetical protein